MEHKKAAQEFKSVFTIYLEAVKNRNGRKVAEFFRDDLPMTHVMPGPRIITDLKSYMDHQRHWHEGNSGSWDYKIHSIEVSPDLALGSVNATYENIDPSTLKPFRLELYISFVFRFIDGQWFMVHSQNSVLKEIR